MDPHLQFVLLSILLLCCLIRDNSFGSRCVVVDFEHHPPGFGWCRDLGICRSPQGCLPFLELLQESPPCVVAREAMADRLLCVVCVNLLIDQAPDASLGHDNSTWLHNADLLVVDTPVGTGNSYEDDASSSGNGVWSMAQTTFPLLRGAFLQAAADILVLLRAPTLAGSAPSSD
ncbi:unnamed protein product [Miscanthus lutarioriparius]|uniref:Secreted protein n=1 Tax=Miscanthus lutarioriparius TaxID=422564 RepID=A0A811Q6Z8_9POAL|nr:unnamed protein product [Miscanthus lutarioriparius]